MQTSDFLIVGGGVVGLCIARELRRRHPDQSVTLIEKELDVGAHASGRNSGVLHAGFYYTADSLKARFTKEGNRRLTEYCLERGLRINRCGKIVAVRDESQFPALDELLKRGKANGIEIREIDEGEAKEIEPRVRTHRRALWSPTTSSVDPLEVVRRMKEDAVAEGVTVQCDTAYRKRLQGNRILTSRGHFEAGFLINTAGLYADRIAQDFDFGREYRILPFKGVYLYSSEAPGAFRTHIYPVPDLRNPFLGTHYTVTVDGRAKIGPTAMPAFWREQYDGVENFCPAEMAEILFRQAGLFLRADFDFRSLAMEEIRKYSRTYLASQASLLAVDVDPASYRKWGKPGIRAQLIHTRKRSLVMDFLLEGDENSLHVLNAVSPAFTCGLSFAEHVCDRIENKESR